MNELANLSDDAIKQAVCQALEAGDRNVEARKTRYFNNTFSPDVVLSWSGSKDYRPVYIRADSNSAHINEDLAFISDSASIVIPLRDLEAETSEREDLEAAAPGGDIPDLEESSDRLTGKRDASIEETNAGAEVQRTAAKRHILVAPFGAVNSLDADEYDSPFAPLVTHAILAGGRGYTSTDSVKQSVRLISQGVRNAGALEEEGLESAIEHAERLLDTSRKNSITGLMQAMWLAGGGRWDTFPVPVEATAKVDSSSLGQLLSMSSFDDKDFWSSIASNITLDKLLASGHKGRSGNLDQLLRFAWKTLKVRMARTERREESDSSEGLLWELVDEGMRLDLPDRTVLFTDWRQGDLSENHSPLSPSLDSIEKLAAEDDIRVLQVDLTNGDKRVTFASESEETVFDDDLSDVESSLGSSYAIRSADVAKTAFRAPMKCTFETATARGKSNSKFSLGEFSETGLPFLLASKEDRDELKRLMPADENSEGSTMQANEDRADLQE